MACKTALDDVDASERAILSMRGARTRPWWQANMSEPETISVSQDVRFSMVAVDRRHTNRNLATTFLVHQTIPKKRFC